MSPIFGMALALSPLLLIYGIAATISVLEKIGFLTERPYEPHPLGCRCDSCIPPGI